MSKSLSRYQIIKMTSRILTGTATMIAALSGLALIENTASADVIQSIQFGCEKGGFTGTIQVGVNVSSSGQINRMYSVAYKINKGGNSGGNKANVGFTDNGTNPSKSFSTGDNGIQDNEWNYFRIGKGYSRAGASYVTARFVFDKSRASDPSCTVSYRL
jgi:hypothetical protein